MSEEQVRLTGGCQCGAVRYALHAAPTDPHICHCRMCQKAAGSFFMPLAGVPRDRFELTRGLLAIFRSSDPVERGFCSACGTPLTFSYRDSDRISVTLGSLDDPTAIPPRAQYGIEARMPWFAELAGLPGSTTEADTSGDRLAQIRSSNHQHPDHDTAEWPARR